jgi:hypothetical protein
MIKEMIVMVSKVLFSSKTPEWYTPESQVKLALRAMDVERFDLDRCSPSQTGEGTHVPANVYYTKELDGLAQQWHGKVWINPPYGREIAKWAAKLYQEYNAGRVTEAVALVPSRLDTNWFQDTLLVSGCIALIAGRIKFISPDGIKSSATFPSTVFYFGPNRDRFSEVYGAMGYVCLCIKDPTF